MQFIFVFVPACDPKLMPTFPQHRNIKGVKTAAAPEANVNTGAGDQTNNLPAISDLVNYCITLVVRIIQFSFYFSWVLWSRNAEWSKLCVKSNYCGMQ